MKKNPYTTTTREVRNDEIHPKFIKYLEEYAGLYMLGDIEKDIQHCYISTNQKKGFFWRLEDKLHRGLFHYRIFILGNHL